MEQYHMQLKQ
jgi:hypothetical protein